MNIYQRIVLILGAVALLAVVLTCPMALLSDGRLMPVDSLFITQVRSFNAWLVPVKQILFIRGLVTATLIFILYLILGATKKKPRLSIGIIIGTILAAILCTAIPCIVSYRSPARVRSRAMQRISEQIEQGQHIMVEEELKRAAIYRSMGKPEEAKEALRRASELSEPRTIRR